MLHLGSMKLLTVGISPLYLTRNSKIHDTIIRNASGEGVELSSIFLEHDSEYFPQDSVDSRYEEIGGTFYCNNEVGDKLITDVFDIIEKESPDIILSIGGFSELEYMRAIKRIVPDVFSWIILLTSNIDDDISDFTETMIESDHVICLTEKTYGGLGKLGVERSLFRYGVDNEYLSNINEAKPKLLQKPTFIVNDKNTQQSNLALIMDAFSCFKNSDFKLILHTNYYENGDYNLDHLMSKLKFGQVEIPDKFIGIKEGDSIENMIKKYREAHFVIDLSIKPVTSLCVFEGMSQGCIPIINKSGTAHEEIRDSEEFPVLQDFLVDNSVFFGQHLEPFYMASKDSFCDKIKKAINLVENNKVEYDRGVSEVSKYMSYFYFNKGFCENIRNLIINGNFNAKKGLKLKILD